MDCIHACDIYTIQPFIGLENESVSSMFNLLENVMPSTNVRKVEHMLYKIQHDFSFSDLIKSNNPNLNFR
jgi:hypothetical protein